MGQKRKIYDQGKMVEMLEKEFKTLGEVGLFFGVSGEAVRQAYYRKTGKRLQTRWTELSERRKKAEEEIRQKFLEDTSFNCESCGEKVDRTKIGNRGLRKYCSKCRAISKFTSRNMGQRKVCLSCKKVFTPFRTRSTPSAYCSRDCYWNSRILVIPHKRGI